MNYWLVRGRPAENDGDFGFMKPGATGRWRTKRPPRNWQTDDRLLFWASSPRLEVISLGEFRGETGRLTADGQAIYKVRYRTAVLDRPLRLQELRADPVLQDAIFLKNGPATSVVRLSNSEGEHMYRLLCRHNRQVDAIWPDISKVREPSLREAVAPEASPSLDVDIHTVAATEGRRRLVWHLERERNQAVVRSKKKQAASLDCETCGFSFRGAYGSAATDYCEVHHLLPLSRVGTATRTRMEDLAILCANCHRVVHLKNPPYTLKQVRALLAK